MNKMFDPNDFLTLFQEGKIDAETIAKDFTAALNEAVAAKQKADEEAQRKREELRAALEKAKATAKTREANEIATRLNAFMKTHYAEFGEEITGAQVIETLEQTMEFVRGLNDFKKHFAGLDEIFGNIQKEEKKDCACQHDPIADFLKKNHLL